MLSFAGPAPAQTAEEARLARLRSEALAAVNRDRVAYGLNPLVLDDVLNAAAQAHAEDMLERDYFAHESPEGESVADRRDAAGGSKWRYVAENLANCSNCPTPPGRRRIAAFQTGWMDSPGHRENLLQPGLTEFGFGAAWTPGEVYAVQVLGGPGTPRGTNNGEGPALAPAALSARMVEIVNRVRAEAGLSLLEPDAGLDAAALRLASNDPDSIIDPVFAEQPFDAVDAADRARWELIRFMATRCGGCGVRPTSADAEAFAQDWMAGGTRRTPLTDPEATHLGLAIRADGAGMKTAVMVLAGDR